MFYNFPLYFSEEVEDRIVDKGKNNEDGYEFRAIGRDELYSSDEND